MSINDIINNPKAVKEWIERDKKIAEDYYKKHPDSLIPSFENELRKSGFEFETSNQTLGFMPKNKKTILPIAIKYYQLAKKQKKVEEQNHFLSFFQFKGIEEVIPMLIEDYYSEETQDLTRWFISDCIYQIRSDNFVKEYLDIVSNRMFGRNRQMIVLLLGKLKEEGAVSKLIDLLEDEEVCLHAICALSEFKREEFRPLFERFQNSKHSGWRKYSKIALKKLNGCGTDDGSLCQK